MTEPQIEIRLQELVLVNPGDPVDDQIASMDSRIELRLEGTAADLYRVIDALTDSAHATERALNQRGGGNDQDRDEIARTRDLADRLEQSFNNAINNTEETTQ